MRRWKSWALPAAGLLLALGGFLLPVYYGWAAAPGDLGPDHWAFIYFMKAAAMAVGATLCILSLLDKNLVILRSKWFVFLLPFVFILLFWWMRVDTHGRNEMYRGYTREDGPVEWSTALFLFGASGLLAITARRGFRLKCLLPSVGLSVLALFVLWLGLEEVSYGQRIFGWGTPGTLAQINYQEETNIHNIEGLGELMDQIGPQLILLWGVTGWAFTLLLSQIRFFSSGWRGWALLLAPPLFLSSFFLPYAIWFYECCTPGGFLVSRDQELAEMFLGLAFLVYGMWAYLGSKTLFTRSIEADIHADPIQGLTDRSLTGG